MKQKDIFTAKLFQSYISSMTVATVLGHTHTKRSRSLIRIKGKYCNAQQLYLCVLYMCVLHLNFDLSGWQEL